MNFSQLSLRIFFISIYALSLIACSDDDSASIRIANLMSDVDEVDLFDNGGTLFSKVNYPQVTDYNNVETGSHELEVTMHNSFTSFGILRRSLNVDTDSTLFAFGTGDDPSLKMIIDDNSNPSSGKSKLRFVQASTTERGVDVYITNPDESIIDAIPSFENRRFQNISNYVESDGGNYRIRVTKTDSLLVLSDSGTINFSSGSVYTVILVDSTSNNGLPEIVIVTDKG